MDYSNQTQYFYIVARINGKIDLQTSYCERTYSCTVIWTLENQESKILPEIKAVDKDNFEDKLEIDNTDFLSPNVNIFCT